MPKKKGEYDTVVNEAKENIFGRGGIISRHARLSMLAPSSARTHSTPALVLRRCVSHAPASNAAGRGNGNGNGTLGTSGTCDSAHEPASEPLRDTFVSELLRDAFASDPDGLLATLLFRLVAALYASGLIGLSSSNVPMLLRHISSGRRWCGTSGCDVFHALGEMGTWKCSAE